MSANIKYKTMEITLNRTIPATPEEAFDGWLDRENPGTVWHGAKKIVLPRHPKVDDLFHFLHVFDEEDAIYPHYGRFTILDRPAKVQYTWMSRHTRGMESIVTVTFRKKGDDTLLTLSHANLPDDDAGHAHEGGWKHYLEIFEERFAKVKA